MTTLTTYQFTRGITKALQSVRDGEEVIVTCEGKEPVLIHKYTGEVCISPPKPVLCDVPGCVVPATGFAGKTSLCAPHFEKATNMAT
jgi:hypothetical protein